MKTAETKIASPASQRQYGKPFFGKGGNAFFETPVQAKLVVGQPNDPYEKEADAMAGKVVQRLQAGEVKKEAAPPVQLKKSPLSKTRTPLVQHKCAHCEAEEKQRRENKEQTDDDEQPVRRKPVFESERNEANAPVPVQRKCEACAREDDQLISRKKIASPVLLNQAPIAQRSACRECDEGHQVLRKPVPAIQPKRYDRTPDADGSRESIVAAAKGEIGKVEARLNDGTGKRIGADRLLEYFHTAAPGVWDDSTIETAGADMPSWCGIFSVWAHKKAGKNIGEWQMGRGVSAFNTLETTTTPQPGDIGYIHLPYQHHAIIKEVEGDTIHSIDGNSGNNSEVKENAKPRSAYTGFFTAFGSGSSAGTVRPKKSPGESMEEESTAAGDIEQRIVESKGQGNLLPDSTRVEMEQSFGADFSQVRIHTDQKAADLSSDLRALAFTHGHDIYFGNGNYDTSSTEGKTLLAHELTHTLQQEGTTAPEEPVRKWGEEEAEEEPFEGAFLLRDRYRELRELRYEAIFDYADIASNEDAAWDDLIDMKLEISRISREMLIIDTVIWNALAQGGLNGQSPEAIIDQAYEASFDEQQTINMVVGEGRTPEETLEIIQGLMTDMPELFPDYIISLYELAVQDLEEKADEHYDEYLEGVNALNDRPVEEIIADFVWMMDNRQALRSSAGQVHFFTWLDAQAPFFLERKDENSTSTELSNLRVRVNDTNINFTSQLTMESLDFLYPVLVSWHHYKFYTGVADQLDFFRIMVQATYERLNEYGSYPDLVADMNRAYHSSAPQVTHDSMRAGFDDIYQRIEQKLDKWVVSLGWTGRISEGFGMYDLYGEIGTQLRQMATPTAIAAMVGFIAFLIAIQYVPYANLVVDAILITLGGIDILKGLTIFGSYFDAASDATTFRQLYRAAQNLRGGGEAILNLLMELIGLGVSRALRAYTRYRGTRRFQNIEEIAGHEVIREGAPRVKQAYGEASTSSRSFQQYERTLNEESLDIFRRDPEVRQIYSEMRTDVRRLLTHCASPCIIPGITRRQVEVVTRMVDRLGGLNPANFNQLKILLHIGQNDMDWLMRILARVDDQAQLERVLLQQFRRRAMEPPGSSPGINRDVAITTPGTCTGGRNLPEVTTPGSWLSHTGGAVALIPRQIARQLRDRTFANWDEFRQAFWQAVSRDPVLRQGFSPQNIGNMRNGYAPAVETAQRHGGEFKYYLHHITPIEHGGGVYDLDNIAVVSPRYHHGIHDGGYPGGGDPFLVNPKADTEANASPGEAGKLEEEIVDSHQSTVPVQRKAALQTAAPFFGPERQERTPFFM